MNHSLQDIDWDKSDGLVPAVVQHSLTGKLLMLAYMNRDALDETRASGRVTFYSRKRQTLWTKGETSGNWLAADHIDLDCDRDTLLIRATPNGPTCHLGYKSCFDTKSEIPGIGFLGELENIIGQRVRTGGRTSYTHQLAQDGIERIAKKVGEEGVELALAAVGGARPEILDEAADLIFHMLLLLQQSEVSLADVTTRLHQRHAQKTA